MPRLLSVVGLLMAASSLGKIKQNEVKAVMCSVCQLAVEKAVEAKLDEDSVDDLCVPNQRHGRWLSKLDILDEPDGSLHVEQMDAPGECRGECSTAARACRKSFDDTEALVQMIQAQKSKRAIVDKMCRKSCKAKRIIVNREKDEQFIQVDPKLSEMQDMMRDMKEKTGMGMKMYSRDDFASMSVGDMETMAAREQLAQDRMEAKAMSGDMGGTE